MIDRVTTEECREIITRDTDILLQHLKLKRKIGECNDICSYQVNYRGYILEFQLPFKLQVVFYYGASAHCFE